MRRRAVLGGLAAAAAAIALPARAQAPDALAKIRNRGTLLVGLYKEMPPFHVDGQGIDVELAAALAESLGVKLAPLPFPADENMNDDLRNMVWRGHYLGYGPADVLLHVPVDPPLMNGNPQVQIFGPYYRERVAIARELAVVPTLDALSDVGKRTIAVPGLSLAGWLLLGADGGAYRDQASTRYADGTAAAAALKRGEVPLAAGLMSELESVLRGDARYAVTPLPSPRAPRDGWAIGMAVKRDAAGLAQALQGGLNEVARNGRLGEMFARANVAWRPV